MKCALLLVAAARMASADPAHFVTLDRQDESSRAGVEASKLFFPSRTGTLLRFDVHGQWVDPGRGAGAYASAPVMFASDDGETQTALGDVELGGIFIPRFEESNFTLIVHGGVTLPTQDESSSPRALDVAQARLTDLFDGEPEGVTVRLGVSPLTRRGRWFTRADLGVDVNVSSKFRDEPNLVRVNVGAGAALGDLALMVETTNLVALGDHSGWFSNGALSARFDAGPVQPYAALVVALITGFSTDMDEAVTVGIEARLP